MISDAEFEAMEREYELYRRVSGRACVGCGKRMFYERGTKALRPGHVYSAAGVDEGSITGLCEWCFDNITLPED